MILVEQMLNVIHVIIVRNADAQVVIVVIQWILVTLLAVTATMIVHLTNDVLMNNVLILVYMAVTAHHVQNAVLKIIWQFVNVHQD